MSGKGSMIFSTNRVEYLVIPMGAKKKEQNLLLLFRI